MSIWQGTGHKAPSSLYWTIAIAGLAGACYKTWLTKFQQLDDARAEVENERKAHLVVKDDALAKIANLELQVRQKPRPKIVMRLVSSGGMAFPRSLKGAAFENVGSVAAHNVRIVPDKTKQFWIEQVGRVDILAPSDPPQHIGLQAICRSDDREDRLIDQDGPIRILLVSMTLAQLAPELFFTVEYEEFDSIGNPFRTPFCLKLDDQRHHASNCWPRTRSPTRSEARSNRIGALRL